MIISDQEKLRNKIHRIALYILAIIIVTFVIAAFIAIKSYKSELVFFSLSAISITLGIITFYVITKKFRKDLQIGTAKTEKQIVKNKFYRTIQVPGDTSKLDSFLMGLSHNILLNKVKLVHKYSVVIDDGNFEITKEEFEQIKIGQSIIIRKGYYSDQYLGIEKINYA